MSSGLLLGLLVSACLVAAGWLAHMHYAQAQASRIRPESEEDRLRALFAQQRELDRQRLERTGEPIILQPLESSYQLWRECLDRCGLYRARPCPTTSQAFSAPSSRSQSLRRRRAPAQHPFADRPWIAQVRREENLRDGTKLSRHWQNTAENARSAK
jgi:hypothetical protein